MHINKIVFNNVPKANPDYIQIGADILRLIGARQNVLRDIYKPSKIISNPPNIELQFPLPVDAFKNIDTYKEIIEYSMRSRIEEHQITAQPVIFQNITGWTYADETKYDFIKKNPHAVIRVEFAGQFNDKEINLLKNKFNKINTPVKEGQLWINSSPGLGRRGNKDPINYAELAYEGKIEEMNLEEKTIETFNFLKEFYKLQVGVSKQNIEYIRAASESTINEPKRKGIYMEICLRDGGASLLYRPSF